MLAPDIQESLLFLPRLSKGKPEIHEKRLRPIAAMLSWEEQRAAWREIEQNEDKGVIRQFINL